MLHKHIYQYSDLLTDHIRVYTWEGERESQPKKHAAHSEDFKGLHVRPSFVGTREGMVALS